MFKDKIETLLSVSDTEEQNSIQTMLEQTQALSKRYATAGYDKKAAAAINVDDKSCINSMFIVNGICVTHNMAVLFPDVHMMPVHKVIKNYVLPMTHEYVKARC